MQVSMKGDWATRMWFHWSPIERRKSIEKVGLVPGHLSRDGLWRPPYVCLSQRPSMAWGLSGGMDREGGPAGYDLWQVDLSEQTGFEILFDDRDQSVKEARVYERVFKRNLWYVGTRMV